MRGTVSKIHKRKNIAKVRQETENNISPELLAVIEDLLRQKAVDPHKEAFSIEDFCRRYGISRTLAYDQINLVERIRQMEPANEPESRGISRVGRDSSV